jgi:pyruvate dehydrogenase E1 component alpha subunit
MAKSPSIPQQAQDDPVAALVGSDGALTPEGERRANVPTETLREMYRLMVICRRLDQEGLNLQRQGELGLWGPLAGHEANQIGAALAMEQSDWIFPYYRSFAMAVARGIDPAHAMAWFRGLTHSPWNPQEHNFGPLIISVGSQIPHAVGLALGCKLDNEQKAVLVSFGEGSTSTGDWHEAMNFAGVFKPPIIFLCENNQWAISVPIQEQVAGRVVDRAAGYGFPGVRVDGVDVLSVYAVVKAAAKRARAGGGPYLIESLSYRLQAHTTADDPTRYRTEDEVAPWRARDPITLCAERLRARDAFDDAYASQRQQEAEDAASSMRQTLLAAKPEHPARVFDSVFRNMPEALRRERDEFLASLETGGAQ